MRPNEKLQEELQNSDASFQNIGERVHPKDIECVVNSDRTLTCSVQLRDEVEVQWREDGEHRIEYLDLWGTDEDAAIVLDKIDALGVSGRGVDGADVNYEPGSPSHADLPDTGVVVDIDGPDTCNLGENGLSCWEA